MEAQEACFTSILATVTADSGAGGLKNSSFGGFVRGPVYLEGDTKAKGPQDRPYISVGIRSQDESPVPNGAATAGANEFFRNIVTFTVVDDRDDRAGLRVDATASAAAKTGRVHRTMARVHALFQNKVLTALVDTDDASRKWYYESMARIALPEATYTDNDVRLSTPYLLYVSKGTV